MTTDDIEQTEQAVVPTITDEQAKAIQSVATFGTTLVTEGSQLVQYMGRILGTIPHDTVGLVLGDPLGFVRTVIAGQYDMLLTKIFKRRNVTQTQPVSPSLAIPLLRAAYDESRSELQQLWAALIAAAMDPKLSGRVRLSLIELLKRLDPLDARIIQQITVHPLTISQDNPVDHLSKCFDVSRDEVSFSLDHLYELGCLDASQNNSPVPRVTAKARLLVRAVSD
jgi:hypothetical protein